MAEQSTTPHRLQRAALIAEIVGALAVVLSLAFVGIQLSRHTDEMVGAAHHELLALLNDNDNWLKDPVFVQTLLRSEEGRDALTETQYLQMEFWFRQRLSLCENVFQRRQDRLVDDDMWSGWSSGCVDVLSNATAREVWRTRGDYFAPDFADWLDTSWKDAS
ncbi:MAG: hypothetical protein AAF668_06405 [Pseudomonadota bacterium]